MLGGASLFSSVGIIAVDPPLGFMCTRPFETIYGFSHLGMCRGRSTKYMKPWNRFSLGSLHILQRVPKNQMPQIAQGIFEVPDTNKRDRSSREISRLGSGTSEPSASRRQEPQGPPVAFHFFLGEGSPTQLETKVGTLIPCLL